MQMIKTMVIMILIIVIMMFLLVMIMIVHEKMIFYSKISLTFIILFTLLPSAIFITIQ